MFTEVAPRFPRNTTGSYFCTFFPASTDPRLEITAAGAGPILLCGTTGNAAAPLQGTRAMADTLEDSHLIVVDAISAGCWECRSAPTTSSPTTSSTSTCPPPRRPTARRNSVENARRSAPARSTRFAPSPDAPGSALSAGRVVPALVATSTVVVAVAIWNHAGAQAQSS